MQIFLMYLIADASYQADPLPNTAVYLVLSALP